MNKLRLLFPQFAITRMPGTGLTTFRQKHRNSIETWSKFPVVYSENMMYNFYSSASQAYGNNLKRIINQGDTIYAIYSGDVNQDGIIDGSDISLIDNDAFNSVSGYVRTDITGNNFVDASDLSVVDNNVFVGVMARRP